MHPQIRQVGPGNCPICGMRPHQERRSGWPFFVRGWQSVLTRNLSMFTLIAMGTGVAWVYSVVATALPGAFPATLRGHEGAVW